MTDRPLRNVAASVRQRLMNAAKRTSRPFQEILQYFAMERFLYRLSQSLHRERFVLKGALMFTVWGAPASRPTRDIDFLGRLNNDVGTIVPIIRDICQQAVEPDGLIFDVDSLAGEVIKEDADYSGVRVTFFAYLENARVPMQIDIGFGDVIVPDALLTDYPTLLELNAPRLRTYPRETVVAEKFEAMVKIGQLNSRLKDFFDLWLLSRQYEFDGRVLSMAVTRTFENRRTEIMPRPVALTDEFANNPIKQTQWTGFLRKSRIQIAPRELPVVIEAIRRFLIPLATAASTGLAFSSTWHPGGPWHASETTNQNWGTSSSG